MSVDEQLIRAIVSTARTVTPMVNFPVTTLEKFLEYVEALRKDAARLDWLDRELATPLNLFDGRYINLEEQGLRFTIDAAMKGQS